MGISRSATSAAARVRSSVAAGRETAEPGHSPEQHGPKVRAAGRIVLRRPSGKVHWLQVRDWTGTIQVMIGKAQVGDANFALAQCLDLGDIIGVDGELKRTMKGELTIFATGLTVLSKSFATPPEKHKGLADPELRQRMRYLDLIHTDGVMETFLRRTKIIQSVRNTLAGRGFAEVEGPMLHAIAGGAAARPFMTHHNALDIDIYLANRVGTAPEAASGRRHRAGLRAWPRLSQRGHRRPAQSRVHDVGSLPGLRQLRDDDGVDRGVDRRGDSGEQGERGEGRGERGREKTR